MDEYEKQAEDFLKRFNLQFSATYISHDLNPLWEDQEARPKYRIRISRKDTGKSVTFHFWDSIAHGQEGKRPTAYDVLACISSDVYCAETFEAFCGDFGYSTDSIKALKTFKVCDRFAKRLRRFFTEKEIEALSKIQ